MLLITPITPLFPYTTLFRSPWPCGVIVVPSRPAGHVRLRDPSRRTPEAGERARERRVVAVDVVGEVDRAVRSEEHTSELQSQFHLVCRLLLEKKNIMQES